MRFFCVFQQLIEHGIFNHKTLGYDNSLCPHLSIDTKIVNIRLLLHNVCEKLIIFFLNKYRVLTIIKMVLIRNYILTTYKQYIKIFLKIVSTNPLKKRLWSVILIEKYLFKDENRLRKYYFGRKFDFCVYHTFKLASRLVKLDCFQKRSSLYGCMTHVAVVAFKESVRFKNKQFSTSARLPIRFTRDGKTAVRGSPYKYLVYYNESQSQ